MSNVAPRRLFRQAALDRLASPEQLDSLVTIADAPGWIAAAGLSLVVAAALAWGIFGRIPTALSAQGILVNKGGHVVGALTPAAGVVSR
ncbi:MAG: hypothetical protein ACREFY_20640, partial [Acetobacteraceae bacterium]